MTQTLRSITAAAVTPQYSFLPFSPLHRPLDSPFAGIKPGHDSRIQVLFACLLTTARTCARPLLQTNPGTYRFQIGQCGDVSSKGSCLGISVLKEPSPFLYRKWLKLFRRTSPDRRCLRQAVTLSEGRRILHYEKCISLNGHTAAQL